MNKPRPTYTNPFNLTLVLLLINILLLNSCSEEQGVSEEDQNNLVVVNINGKAQKGPFVIGSDITISELDSDLIPTGRTFNSKIHDEDGAFEILQIELESDYVEIKAEGFYYDEVDGSVSQKELTITSLAKVIEGQVSNTNLLTQLESKRIKLLMSEGFSFEEAKKQSYSDLVDVFGITSIVESSNNTSNLDLSIQGKDGAFLLAASVILSSVEETKQWSSESYADWLKFLLDFEEDFSDGKIDSEILKDKMRKGASVIKWRLLDIRNDMETAYNFKVPEFEPIYLEYLSQNPIEFSSEEIYNLFFLEDFGDSLNIISLPSGISLDKENNHAISMSSGSASPYEFEMDILLRVVSGTNASFSTDTDLWSSINDNDEGTDYLLSINHSNSSVVIIPFSFTGEGTIDLTIDLSIEGTNQVPIEKSFTWSE